MSREMIEAVNAYTAAEYVRSGKGRVDRAHYTGFTVATDGRSAETGGVYALHRIDGVDSEVGIPPIVVPLYAFGPIGTAFAKRPILSFSDGTLASVRSVAGMMDHWIWDVRVRGNRVHEVADFWDERDAATGELLTWSFILWFIGESPLEVEVTY